MDEIVSIIQSKIRELSVRRKLEGKSIFLFGYNVFTEYIKLFLNKEGYALCGIIDNDKEKQGKKVCNAFVYAPEYIEWRTNSTVVLIASRHVESMIKQVRSLSNEADIFVLADLNYWDKQQEAERKFWLDENYETEIRKLYCGAEVYKKVKQEELLLVLDFSSIGDAFLIGLCFEEYQNLKLQKIKVIAGSKAACKVLEMFGIIAATVSRDELLTLSKFIDFSTDKMRKEAACTWTFRTQYICTYKGYSFSQFFPRFLFQLGNDYRRHFPSIWDTEIKEREFIEKGLVKGKSVVLAPYANTVEELPRQFWECLTAKLLEKNYCVFTNIAGKQRPVRRSIGMEIPLEQIGSYLEYAGYFVALRSGLCDIVGHSQCRQIVIFRDKYVAPNSSEVVFFDLHSEKISEDAIQYVYDNNDLLKNVKKIMDLLVDGKQEPL